MFFSQLLIESYKANKTPKLSVIYFGPFFANLDASHRLIWGWNPTRFSPNVSQLSLSPNRIYLLHKPEYIHVVIEIKILLGFLVNNKKIFCKNGSVQDGRRLLFKNNTTIFKSNYSVRATLWSKDKFIYGHLNRGKLLCFALCWYETV